MPEYPTATATGLLHRILPAGVVAVETFGDPPEAVLLPEEEPVIAAAVDRRRREFTTVRYCARRALAALGRPGTAILPGHRNAPQWPAGVVGSMTHCDGYRAAALGEADRFASIGIDAEPHAPLPAGVFNLVASPAERSRAAELGGRWPAICWDRLLFTAKEAVYKAWFPLTGRWLGFEEAEVTFDPAARTFVARLLVPGPDCGTGPLDAFHGRYDVAVGFAITAIAIDRPAALRGP